MIKLISKYYHSLFQFYGELARAILHKFDRLWYDIIVLKMARAIDAL
jgi:hypothetical protein